jgi:hypothetical protein
MIAVGNESGTINLFSYPNAETRHDLIRCKTNDGGYRHRPQMLNGLGI